MYPYYIGCEQRAWSSSHVAVVLLVITSNARNGVLYWLKSQQVLWKSAPTSLFSGIRPVTGPAEQEAISKATVTLVSPKPQRNPRNSRYPLYVHHLVFCIFYVIAMLAPLFQTPTHKHIKLPGLINIQEQLRSFS